MNIQPKQPRITIPDVDVDAGKEVHQRLLEEHYNKNQLFTRLRDVYENCDSFNFPEYMRQGGLDPHFGIDLMIQMVLHKQTTVAVMTGILRHHTCKGATTSEELSEGLQQCADLIQIAVDLNLVSWNQASSRLIVVFDITQELQRELDMFQYPLPMVVQPLTVKSNKQNGYLTTSGSLILRDNHHDDDICLDHINRMNRIKFNIDHDTAHMIHNSWKNLDKAKDGESRQDYVKRLKAFMKYDNTAKEVVDLLVQEGEEFHLTHKYDKRGRTYSQGYHVNYQGNQWNKAVVELAEKELIT